MSLSNTTLRLITVLFLLAGILLLRKPVFGETITATPSVSPSSSQNSQIQAAHPFVVSLR
jgi:hypothetical protein